MGFGVSDVTIAAGIIVVFVVLGITLPYIHQAAGSNDYVSQDVNALKTSAGAGATNIGSITIGSSLLAIGKMFSWSFGAIPFWIELVIFIPMRLILLILIIRNFPVIGRGSG